MIFRLTKHILSFPLLISSPFDACLPVGRGEDEGGGGPFDRLRVNHGELVEPSPSPTSPPTRGGEFV